MIIPQLPSSQSQCCYLIPGPLRPAVIGPPVSLLPSSSIIGLKVKQDKNRRWLSVNLTCRATGNIEMSGARAEQRWSKIPRFPGARPCPARVPRGYGRGSAFGLFCIGNYFLKKNSKNLGSLMEMIPTWSAGHSLGVVFKGCSLCPVRNCPLNARVLFCNLSHLLLYFLPDSWHPEKSCWPHFLKSVDQRPLESLVIRKPDGCSTIGRQVDVNHLQAMVSRN